MYSKKKALVCILIFLQHSCWKSACSIQNTVLMDVIGFQSFIWLNIKYYCIRFLSNRVNAFFFADEQWEPLLLDPVCGPARDQLAGGTPTLVSKPVHRRAQEDQECPWGEEPLPIDLERCLTANLLEIKEYNVFVNKPINKQVDIFSIFMRNN